MNFCWFDECYNLQGLRKIFYYDKVIHACNTHALNDGIGCTKKRPWWK